MTTTEATTMTTEGAELSSSPDAPVAPGRARLTAILIGALVVAADVATKTWAVARLGADPISLAGGTVVFTESRNPGAAFGMATSMTPVLAVIAAAAVGGLLVFAPRVRGRWALAAVGLGLGGAAGNLVDRLFRAPGPLRGHVVDWIDIGSWPTFNLADSALVSAAAIALVLSVAPAARPQRDVL